MATQRTDVPCATPCYVGFLPWSPCVSDSCRLAPADAARVKEIADDPVIDVDPHLENDELENNELENNLKEDL